MRIKSKRIILFAARPYIDYLSFRLTLLEKMVTPEQKAFLFCSLWNEKLELQLNVPSVKGFHCNPLCDSNIRWEENQFQNTRFPSNVKNMCRPRVSEENFEHVRKSFLHMKLGNINEFDFVKYYKEKKIIRNCSCFIVNYFIKTIYFKSLTRFMMSYLKLDSFI